MTTAEEAHTVTPDELARHGSPDAPTADSPGIQLKRAREARGLDVSQLAASLRIAPQVVEALEQDDYARLPSAVFVSGYIRSYARLVGLDPEPLNQRFRRLHPNAEPPPRHIARSEGEDAELEGGGLGIYLVAALVILAILAGGYGWWVSRPGQSQIPTEQTSTQPSPNRDRASEPPLPVSSDDRQLRDQPRLSAPASNTETDATAAPEAVDDAASKRAGDQRTDSSSPPQATSADVIVVKQGDQQYASTARQASNAPTGEAAGASGDSTSETLTDRSGDNAAARAPTQAQAGAALPTPASPEDERPADARSAMASAGNTATGAEAGETEAASNLATDTTADSGIGESSPRPVELSFSGTCWVDIRDSTGEVLLFGEMSRGDREILGGEPPYSLVIGNAAAAEITVAGQPYDLGSVARGNVARFELDPAEFSTQSTNPSPGTAVDPND